MIELNGPGLDLSKALVLNGCITSKPAEGGMWVLITELAKKFEFFQKKLWKTQLHFGSTEYNYRMLVKVKMGKAHKVGWT